MPPILHRAAIKRTEGEWDSRLESILNCKLHLHWLGQVTRMGGNRLRKQANKWQVEGFRKGPGIPRQMWRSTDDLRELKLKLSWKDVAAAGSDVVSMWTSTLWMLDESSSESRSHNVAHLQRQLSFLSATITVSRQTIFGRPFAKWFALCYRTVVLSLSLIHIWRCRRIERCRSRWSPYH